MADGQHTTTAPRVDWDRLRAAALAATESTSPTRTESVVDPGADGGPAASSTARADAAAEPAA